MLDINTLFTQTGLCENGLKLKKKVKFWTEYIVATNSELARDCILYLKCMKRCDCRQELVLHNVIQKCILVCQKDGNLLWYVYTLRTVCMISYHNASNVK